MAELVEASLFFNKRVMSFWAYMMHCADSTFYTGHSDDLERRVAQHEQGLVPGYTSERLPVKLVWSQEFGARDEARAAEQQIKGWGRAKKLALIRGDWAAISLLAKGRNSKEGASTSSAKPVWKAERFLLPHPAAMPTEDLCLQANLRRLGDHLLLRFRLTGSLDLINIADLGARSRADELWRTTCFEAFIQARGEAGYFEYNFSPSSRWQVYSFQGYRAGLDRPPVSAPSISRERSRYALTLRVLIPLPPKAESFRANLTAVLEEKSGRKSYWALAHPPEGPPDFHHPDCFVLNLPPPMRP